MNEYIVPAASNTEHTDPAMLPHILTPLPSQNRLSTSHACSHEHKVPQLEAFNHMDRVVCKRFICNGLFPSRAIPIAFPKSTSVTGNAADTECLAQRQHEMIKHQRAHRPAVNEDQGKLRQGSGNWLIGLDWLGGCCGSVVTVKELCSVAWGSDIRHYEDG